ncbi:hypothetical protein PC110_g5189 [Phytophthora cactorum]|uniref:Tc1-like transposase DDE domain-containing protein n=2 Tax=Phytophthora cactorum TaxID=29920 RepID=A0A329SPQ8_9STRA|nr:hypothetical protein PC120_g1574 [Phytophthora cactorum]RAW38585.1 hypothetical protein PC110_g5189 [Phytophthora cactorum]
MASQLRTLKHTITEKQRVFDAHRAGRHDWLAVAASNDIPTTTTYNLVRRGRADDLPRGGARHIKMTPEAKACLEQYLDEDCTYTLNQLRTSFSSTVIKSASSNNGGYKEKRRVFAEKLKAHQSEGNGIVYYDETNFNVYLKRQRGGQQAVVKLPPSKGANLQAHCAVFSAIGVVTSRVQRSSIRMDKIAAFVEEIYKAVKASSVFQNCFRNEKIVIALDNALDHRQTEERCFSVLKAHIKNYLAVYCYDICDRSRQPDQNGEVLSFVERLMHILERAAKRNMKVMTSALVANMERHCNDSVNCAAAS